jgi:hypothetical protein
LQIADCVIAKEGVWTSVTEISSLSHFEFIDVLYVYVDALAAKKSKPLGELVLWEYWCVRPR